VAIEHKVFEFTHSALMIERGVDARILGSLHTLPGRLYGLLRVADLDLENLCLPLTLHIDLFSLSQVLPFGSSSGKSCAGSAQVIWMCKWIGAQQRPQLLLLYLPAAPKPLRTKIRRN
jgi:hypothetical protein